MLTCLIVSGATTTGKPKNRSTYEALYLYKWTDTPQRSKESGRISKEIVAKYFKISGKIIIGL